MATPGNPEPAGGGTEPPGAGAASAGGPAGKGASGDRAAAGTRHHRFRQWRRSRPFWGGLLVLLAGAELLLIPLMNVFMLAAAGLMMSMGIGGISGFLLGIVLAACGVLLWFDPAHRVFYGVIGLAGGVISFPATNFGGFFIGLLLAVIGGALAVGWTPLPGEPAGRAGGATAGPRPGIREGRYADPEPREPGEGLGLILSAPLPGDGPAAAGDATAGDEVPGTGAGEGYIARPARPSHRRGSWRSRLLPGSGGRATVLALAVAGSLAASPLLAARPAAAAARSAPQPAPSQSCLLGILCPSPAPSPVPSGSPSPGLPLPVPLPLPSGLPVAGSQPGPGAKQLISPSARPTAGIVAYSSPVTLSAGAVRVTGFAYQGVADVPAAGGGTVPMMKFTASTLTASHGVTGRIAQGGNTTTLAAGSLDFRGGITLYATRFSGRLFGVPVTLAPGNAESVLVHLLKSVTPAQPLTMTSVVANQPIIAAPAFAGQFSLSAG